MEDQKIEKIKLGSVYLDTGVWSPGVVCSNGKFSIGDTFRNYEVQWVAVNGKLYADRNVCTNMTFASIVRQKLTSGTVITIDGTCYVCRIPFVSGNNDDYNEWKEVIRQTTTSNDVWHYRGSASWMYRTDPPEGRAVIGHTVPADWPVEFADRRKSQQIGFRPVLTPTPVKAGLDDLVKASLTIITPGEAIYGTLVEYSDYDLLLKPAKPLADATGKRAVYVDDDLVAVNRSQVLHICLRFPPAKPKWNTLKNKECA